jgi:hypothetical protein
MTDHFTLCRLAHLRNLLQAAVAQLPYRPEYFRAIRYLAEAERADDLLEEIGRYVFDLEAEQEDITRTLRNDIGQKAEQHQPL